MFKDIVVRNRSYRRFYQDERISMQTLHDLIDLARNTGCATNGQALRFRLINDEADCQKMFESLAWAGRLPDWPGPSEGERPTAYILILVEKALGAKRDTDVGIAAQTILLGATELGLGGCMFGSIKREEVMAWQGLDPEKYVFPLVIALGKPKEDVRIVDVPESGDIAYYRDANGVHYVPKRALDDLII